MNPRLSHEHTPEAIRRRLSAGARPSYLRDFVYGAVDGTVTTFAVVAGAAGADIGASVALILGAANLIGDGFSMAVGNFLSTRSEIESRAHLREEELRHIAVQPEGEREEVRQIFAAKVFEGADLERAVEIITADRERWIETMLNEEFGLPPVDRSPWLSGLSTFAAFLAAGSVPLLAFALGLWRPGSAQNPASATALDPFHLSTILTGATFFAIGALKGVVLGRGRIRSGLETLAVGGLAAFLAYLTALFIRRLGQ